MSRLPPVCIPIARCGACGAKATRYLHSEGKLVPGVKLCRPCAARTLMEYRSVLGERWGTVEIMEPEGCAVPAGATFPRLWPEMIGGTRRHDPLLTP